MRIAVRRNVQPVAIPARQRCPAVICRRNEIGTVLNDVGTPAAIGSFRTLEIVGTISSYAANDREPAAVLHGVLRIPFSRLNFCKTQTTALGQCLLLFRSQVVP